MDIKKITLAVSVTLVSLTAGAQSKTSTSEQTPVFGANRYNRTLGINNYRNLPDAQLRKIGEKVSANTYPTKNTARQLLKSAVAKQMAQKKIAVAEPHMYSANYMASDTLFWDSFEDWDGQTVPFISTVKNKWSTKSNIKNITPYVNDGLCPTWTTLGGDGYYVPYAKDGELMLVCTYGGEVYADNNHTVVMVQAPQQDEWIVSPAITKLAKTNYLSFDICYSPWNTHYFIEGTDSIFDMKRVAYDMEVLITTKAGTASYNAEDYTTVYKLSEEVDKAIGNINTDNKEEAASLMYMNWHHVQIPLDKYAGNDIRIAFRYTGTKGGSVLIDAIRVSDLLPVANYDVPAGAFYWGFSEDMYSMINSETPYKHAFIPAYVPSVWNNLSNYDSKTFTWTYDIEGEKAQSNDINLLMPSATPSALVSMPTLKAEAGARSNEMSNGVFNIGGNTQLMMGNGQVVYYTVGNYDLTKSWWTAEVGQPGSQCYAFGTGSGSFWAANSNYRYNSVEGIGNYFEKPLAPYVFNEVTLPLGDYLNFGATLACTIYKVDEEGYITDEIIAQSVFNPNASKPNGSCVEVPNTGGMYMLKFVFKDAMVIDEPIFICIDGFSNTMLMSIAPLSQALNHDNEMGTAFVILNTQRNGSEFINISDVLAGLDTNENMNVSHCISLNAIFPYLHSDDGDVFCAKNEGETKAFNLSTYWSPDDWTIKSSDSWIKTKKVVNAITQSASVQVITEALPEGTQGRTGTVTVSALGCSETITVLQGEAVTSIAEISANNATEGTFTLSGQRINSSDAKNGIFLVKKNGKFVKMIK